MADILMVNERTVELQADTVIVSHTVGASTTVTTVVQIRASERNLFDELKKSGQNLHFVLKTAQETRDFFGRVARIIPNSLSVGLIQVEIQGGFQREVLISGVRREEWQTGRLLTTKSRVESSFRAGPVLIIHILPLATQQMIDLSQVPTLERSLLPVHYPLLQFDGRINRLGFEATAKHRAEEVGVAQLFKDGQIEAVRSLEGKDGEIFGLMLDHDIVMSVLAYVGLLSTWHIPLPIIASISLMRVKGCWIVTQPSGMARLPRVSIPEDSFTLPDVLISSVSQAREAKNMAQALRPVLDEIWQASGYDRSYSFERSGKWQGPFA